MAFYKNILAISGSTRRESSNLQILKDIKSNYKESFNIEIYPSINNLPHFNPDDDNDVSLPPLVKEFREKIAKADGILICTPEYVFSLPGSLKNALEWTIGTILFDKKPVALITASGLGDQAHESLKLIMKTMSARFNEQTQLLIKGARSKLDMNGKINDMDTKERIDILMKSFEKIIDSVQDDN